MNATELELELCEIIHAEHNLGRRIDLDGPLTCEKADIESSDCYQMKLLKTVYNSSKYFTARHSAANAFFYKPNMKEKEKQWASELEAMLNAPNAETGVIEDALRFSEIIESEKLVNLAKLNYEAGSFDKEKTRDVLKMLYSINRHPHNSETIMKFAGMVLGYSERRINFHLRHGEMMTALAASSIVCAALLGSLFGAAKLAEIIYHAVK